MTELEKAAKEELLHSYATIVDGELAYQRQAMLTMFRKGAEWQAKQSPWISVEERLPEEEKGYFVMVENSFPKNTNVVIGEFYNDNNKFYDEATDCAINDVIAWMPIPSFDEILEANKDVLKQIKEKGRCPEFPYFGASYPDARCIGGYLYDLDDCDEDGNLYEKDNGIPCPFCKTDAFIEYDPFSKIDEFFENDGAGLDRCIAEAKKKTREWYIKWIEKTRERYE